MRILVADDSSTMRAIIIDAIRLAGAAEIAEAKDGRDALTQFMNGQFDMVVIDWFMPDGNGLHVTRAIRMSGSDVPIIMVTATGTAREQVVEAIQAGVSDYVLKPFDVESLAAKVKKLAGKKTASVG